MFVNEIEYENKIVKLCSTPLNTEDNIYTLIIGRNGCGKSNLLKKICSLNIQSLLGAEQSHSYQYESELDVETTTNNRLKFSSQSSTYEISITPRIHTFENTNLSMYPYSMHKEIIDHHNNPKFNIPIISRHISPHSKDTTFQHLKIIAVSSSPFDKFPLINSFTLSSELIFKNYLYRGARTQTNIPKSYLKSKFDQLGVSFLNLLLKQYEKKPEILKLFEYLGFSSKFKIILKSSTRSSFDQILNNENKLNLDEMVYSSRARKGTFGATNRISNEEIDKIIIATKTIQHNNPHEKPSSPYDQIPFTLEIDLNTPSATNQYINEYATLINYDLIDLEDIEFHKHKDNSNLFLTKASSGELCLLFNILAIAAEISNNSVILIDEPELSLHPEWQQDFLPLLSSIFSNYKNCHFIIATHSAQIASSISNENIYIVNLEQNPPQIFTGSDISSKSPSYQLAYIFNAPGVRNDYLITEIIDALTSIRDGRELDYSFAKKINSLLNFRKLVPTSDPAYKLLTTLKKALRIIKK